MLILKLAANATLWWLQQKPWKTEFFAYVISRTWSTNQQKQLHSYAFHLKTSQSAKNQLDPAKMKISPKCYIRPFCTKAFSHVCNHDLSSRLRCCGSFQAIFVVVLVKEVRGMDTPIQKSPAKCCHQKKERRPAAIPPRSEDWCLEGPRARGSRKRNHQGRPKSLFQRRVAIFTGLCLWSHKPPEDKEREEIKPHMQIGPNPFERSHKCRRSPPTLNDQWRC